MDGRRLVNKAGNWKSTEEWNFRHIKDVYETLVINGVKGAPEKIGEDVYIEKASEANKAQYVQACRPMAHPIFRRSVNPISTRGDRVCPPKYYWHTQIFRPSNGPGKYKKIIQKFSPHVVKKMGLRQNLSKFMSI